jgi:hypothetical protein
MSGREEGADKKLDSKDHGNLVVHWQYKLGTIPRRYVLISPSGPHPESAPCLLTLFKHQNISFFERQIGSLLMWPRFSICLWNDFLWFWWLNEWVAFHNTCCAFWLMCHPQSASLDVILFVLQLWDHLDLPPTPRNMVSSWNMMGRYGYSAFFATSAVKKCSFLICWPGMLWSAFVGRQQVSKKYSELLRGLGLSEQWECLS